MSWWTKNRKWALPAIIGTIAAPYAMPALGGLLGGAAAGEAAAGAAAAGAGGAATGALGSGTSLLGTGLSEGALIPELAGSSPGGISALTGTGLSNTAAALNTAPGGFMNAGLLQAGNPAMLSNLSSAPTFMEQALAAGKTGLTGLGKASATMGAVNAATAPFGGLMGGKQEPPPRMPQAPQAPQPTQFAGYGQDAQLQAMAMKLGVTVEQLKQMMGRQA